MVEAEGNGLVGRRRNRLAQFATPLSVPSEIFDVIVRYLSETVRPRVKKTRGQIVVGLCQENRELLRCLEELTPDEWNGPTLCAEWTVRDVVAHLIGQADDFLNEKHSKTLRALTKQGVDAVLPFLIATNKRHIVEGRHFSRSELLLQLRGRRGRAAVRLSQIPGFAWFIKVKGTAPMRVHEALGTHVLEAWVHRQDIQRPRGHADDEGPFDILLPVVFFGVVQQRAYEPSGSVDVDLGSCGVWNLAPGGAGFQPRGSQPARAIVSLSAAEFVLIAAGRVDPDGAAATIKGEQGLGMELLYSLRFMGLVPGL